MVPDSPPVVSARYGPRLGNASGGTPNQEYPYAHPSVLRQSSAPNDQQTIYSRSPWYYDSYYIPPAAGEVSWTAAGPLRPELHQRTFSWRRWSGAYDQQQEGMHSMLPPAPKFTPNQNGTKLKKYAVMRPGRQNRITVQRYFGQSYSQTTLPQGVGK